VQLSTTVSEKYEEMILTQLQECDAVVFNPATLLRVHPSLAPREASLERFRRVGFCMIQESPTTRSSIAPSLMLDGS
jgi:hypothetical protein